MIQEECQSRPAVQLTTSSPLPPKQQRRRRILLVIRSLPPTLLARIQKDIRNFQKNVVFLDDILAQYNIQFRHKADICLQQCRQDINRCRHYNLHTSPYHAKSKSLTMITEVFFTISFINHYNQSFFAKPQHQHSTQLELICGHETLSLHNIPITIPFIAIKLKV